MLASFSVNAKSNGRSTPADIRAMLRSLLADRFELRARMDTREMPVFALMRIHADRLGTDLQPVQAPDCTPSQMSIESLAALSAAGPRQPGCPRSSKTEPSGAVNKIERGPMAALIDSLAENVTSRPIIDATGLQGMYEWRLRYQMFLPDDPDGPLQAPSVLDAVPEQLGLKLEPRSAPLQVLVIDSIKQPTPD
jgi:uncharacterized protein (TIGR03435 family)